jgi:predicted HTH domain antitoxin
MNTSIDYLIQKLQQKIISLKKLVKSSSAQINEMNSKLETEKLKIVNRVQSQLQEETEEPKLLAKSTKNYNIEKEQIENYLEQII